MKRLIVTGDDFGLAEPVNEAIERAHRDGVLTAASLMVGAAAAADAVARARRLPELRVGLHLVLVEGRPLLPPSRIPDLVDSEGRFPDRLVRSGMRFFFAPRVRAQVEAEIGAQFQAFAATGLELDHVNTHNHMHMHPTVLTLLLRIGRRYGLRAVRVPYEPPIRSWAAARSSLASRLAASALLSPWAAWMKLRLHGAGIRSNDFVFGMFDSGRMTTERALGILARLPDGVTEIYFHPSTRRCPEIERTMPGYLHEQELAALTSGRVREAIRAAGVRRIAFSDI